MHRLPPADIPQWSLDAAGQIHAERDAEFWRVDAGGTITCDLCYRRCELAPGAAGWCRSRVNVDGILRIPEHGVLSQLQPYRMAYPGGIRTFDPGALTMGIGGTHCTAGCSFCYVGEISLHPERLGWLGGRERGMGTDGGWGHIKSMVHPTGVIQTAQRWGADHIVFSMNEPLLSYEFTFDVARLAKAAGMKVILYTNGFAEPAVIRTIAPYVDAVDLGIKGSLALAFYTTYMRSPGGEDAVKRAAVEWKRSGVYLLLSDVIATEHMQDADAHVAAQERLYAWVGATLGPQTPILISTMHHPSTATRLLVPRTEEAYGTYLGRLHAARSRAHAAGLHYAHSMFNEPITCHQCGGLLLKLPEGECPSVTCRMFTPGSCDCGRCTHTQHVTDGRCDHCGAAVPIVTLSHARLAAIRAAIAGN